jgi:hypothetical protein
MGGETAAVRMEGAVVGDGVSGAIGAILREVSASAK